MNIVFRVDATKNIGMGHLMRCFALSEELIKEKNTCYFLSNIDNKELRDKISKKNIQIERISTSPESGQDLDKLIEFSKNNDADWIITDHYGIDSEYIKKIKDNGFKVLSIDDTSQIHYHSDIVLNQNIGAEKLAYKADEKTKFLLGTKYIMLRDEILKKSEKRTGENVKKILVTMGGANNDDLTAKILRLLSECIDESIEIEVIIGPLNEKNNEILDEKKNNIKFVFSPENMADVYLQSDMAISAGGSSCYELAYFGIPNIIITIADNQRHVSEELNEKNVGIHIGEKKDFSPERLKENIFDLIDNYSKRKKMIENGMDLVDGEGKKRIVEFMNKQ